MKTGHEPMNMPRLDAGAERQDVPDHMPGLKLDQSHKAII